MPVIRCSHCILPETYPHISFNDEGTCNYCENYTGFVPRPEDELIQLFEKAKRKHRTYDALVPLSGGKDSTYVLYLAKRVYGLNVLAFTFDNGFFNELALDNIRTTVGMLNVDHVFFRPNWETLKKLYRSVLLRTGELCTVCGIGIVNGYLKVSEDWHIPLILVGASVTEEKSYSPENIYDNNRFKAVTKNSNGITDKEINDFLIYRDLNPVRRQLYSMTGRFGKVVSPLYYLPKKKEGEIAELLKRELAWEDNSGSREDKHFDCLAESFTNHIREHRCGYSRKAGQYSNMIRLGELTREDALAKLSKDNPGAQPENTGQILEKLDISADEFEDILKLPLFQYEKYCYRTSKLLKQLAGVLNRE